MGCRYGPSHPAGGRATGQRVGRGFKRPSKSFFTPLSCAPLKKYTDNRTSRVQ